ncbi:MAG: urea transport system permease protein [Lentisphaeria bacterium]
MLSSEVKIKSATCQPGGAFFNSFMVQTMKHYLIHLKYLFVGLLFASTQVYSDAFEQVLNKLSSSSNSEKVKVINALAETKDPRVLVTLSALLGAKLYYSEENNQFVIIEERSEADGAEGTIDAIDVLTGSLLDSVSEESLAKIRITNKLRRVLRSNIAVLELASEDKDLRLKSAQNMAKKPDADLRELIVSSIKSETVFQVRDSMKIVLALIDIKSRDHELRINAVDILGSTVEPQAVGALKMLLEKNADGDYLESNTELVKKVEITFKSVKSRLGVYKFAENLLFGLSLGSILLLAAIGLAITFGVMGVINMAHGEMIMLGAYTTFAIQQLFPGLIDYSLFIAIPAAFVVAGSVGMLIERLVIRHLYGRPLDTLLATFGVSLILQQAVRTYSSNSVPVVSPEWISGAWEINGAIALTFNRIYILFFSLIVLGVLALILKKTLMGLQMRAVTQNRAMANSMGIKSSWVDALTFGLGSGIAGIAGVALSQIDSVSPNLGQAYIVDTFMVVVFGGVGNIMGTFFGAISLGVINKFLEPYTGAVIGKIMVLVFIILFIQWRPRGLFALKGRFVED